MARFRRYPQGRTRSGLRTWSPFTSPWNRFVRTGEFPAVSLKKARALGSEVNEKVARGEDRSRPGSLRAFLAAVFGVCRKSHKSFDQGSLGLLFGV